jgi:hypothetical protein
MTPANTVLRRLDELGAKICVENGRLKLRSTSQVVPKAIVTQVCAARAEIIALLAPSGRVDAKIGSGPTAAWRTPRSSICGWLRGEPVHRHRAM